MDKVRQVAHRLDKASGIALWRQVADCLRVEMFTLADEKGRLPIEKDLAALFQVNRLTLRTAVTALVDEGLLSREQGRGTFVVPRKRLKYPIGRRTRFSAGLEMQADERTVSVMSSQQEPANSEVAEALNMPPGEATVKVELLSFADKVPIIRTTSWFSNARFDGIDQLIQHYQSVTLALRDKGVADYVRAKTNIEAHHAQRQDVQALKLAPGAIVLVATAVNEDLNGSPIQYAISRMAADRIVLSVEN